MLTKRILLIQLTFNHLRKLHLQFGKD